MSLIPTEEGQRQEAVSKSGVVLCSNAGHHHVHLYDRHKVLHSTPHLVFRNQQCLSERDMRFFPCSIQSFIHRQAHWRLPLTHCHCELQTQPAFLQPVASIPPTRCFGSLCLFLCPGFQVTALLYSGEHVDDQYCPSLGSSLELAL